MNVRTSERTNERKCAESVRRGRAYRFALEGDLALLRRVLYEEEEYARGTRRTSQWGQRHKYNSLKKSFHSDRNPRSW